MESKINDCASLRQKDGVRSIPSLSLRNDNERSISPIDFTLTLSVPRDPIPIDSSGTELSGPKNQSSLTVPPVESIKSKVSVEDLWLLARRWNAVFHRHVFAKWRRTVFILRKFVQMSAQRRSVRVSIFFFAWATLSPMLQKRGRESAFAGKLVKNLLQSQGSVSHSSRLGMLRIEVSDALAARGLDPTLGVEALVAFDKARLMMHQDRFRGTTPFRLISVESLPTHLRNRESYDHCKHHQSNISSSELFAIRRRFDLSCCLKVRSCSMVLVAALKFEEL